MLNTHSVEVFIHFWKAVIFNSGGINCQFTIISYIIEAKLVHSVFITTEMVSTLNDLLPAIRNHDELQLQTESVDMDAEMHHYLEKLKQLVPKCQKYKRISKLKLIQHVIDYICDLQRTLEGRSLRESNSANSSSLQASTTRPRHLGKRRPLETLPVSLSENLQTSSVSSSRNRTSF